MKLDLKLWEKAVVIIFVMISLVDFTLFFSVFNIQLEGVSTLVYWFFKVSKVIFFITHLCGSIFLGIFILCFFKKEKKEEKDKPEKKRKKKELLKG
jgi:uncharacterized membrane protein YuzA (DUF378 family)